MLNYKNFSVYAYHDKDDRLKVFSSASFPECVSVAQALYSSSDLEFKILTPDGVSLVYFIKPFDKK